MYVGLRKLVLISTLTQNIMFCFYHTFLRRYLSVAIAVIDGLAALAVYLRIKLYSVILRWMPQSKQMPRLMNNGLVVDH